MNLSIKCVCNICKIVTNHEILYSCDDKHHDDTFYKEYQVIRCCGCDTIGFRYTNRKPFNWGSNGEIKPTEELYPPRKLCRDPIEVYWLPKKVKQIYREVHLAIRNNLKIVAAIAIRSTVEEVCKDKNCPGKNLKQKITQLGEYNFVSDEQTLCLHTQRLFGNSAAHDLIEPEDSELIAAMDILDNILETIYVAPKRKAWMESRARRREKEKKE